MNNLTDLISQYRMLSTANVSDGLDRISFNGTPHGIGPLWDACSKIVGPACTLKLVGVDEADESPVLGTLRAITHGHAGDVLVIDHGGRTDINSYGGVAGFTTFHKGLVGCVIDGVTRDIDEYKDLSLPVYGRGFIQQSIRNRCACAGYQIQVELGGVPVHPEIWSWLTRTEFVLFPRIEWKKFLAMPNYSNRSKIKLSKRSETVLTP